MQRHDFNSTQRFNTALIIQVKTAHRINSIIKPFDPGRILTIDRENIKNITAQTKLTDGIYLSSTLVSQFDQTFQQLLLLKLLPQCYDNAASQNLLQYRQLLQQCFRSHKIDTPFFPLQDTHRRHAPSLNLTIPRISLHHRQIDRIQFLHQQIRIKTIQSPAVFTNIVPAAKQKH